MLALTAGIDVELPDTIGFGRDWSTRSASGELSEDLVDRAVARLLTQKVELGLLDPDWTPEGSVRDAVDRSRLGGQPGTGPGDGRALRRPARRRHGPAAARRGPTDADAARGGRTVRGRPADVHGLLRLPQPRAAALSRASGSASRCRPASTPCAPSCPTSRSSYAAGLRGAAARTAPASPPRSRRRGRRSVRRVRRRPGRPVRARHLRRGLRRRGPAAARAAGRPARRAARDRHAGRGRRRLRASLRARRVRTAGQPASSRPSCPARRAAQRDRRRPVRPGRSPAASCRCRSRGTPGGQPSTYLQPPLGGAGERRHQQPRRRHRCSPSATARRTRRFAVDDLRLSDTEIGTDGEFTVDGAGAQHRERGRRRGRPALPARRAWRRWPGR